MTWSSSLEHRVARAQASLDLARTGTGDSIIQLFATPQPALGGAPGDDPLVEMVLDLAASAVNPSTGLIALVQADAGGDLILIEGDAVWGRWWARNGTTLMGDGNVSDEAGAGFFKVAGTAGTHLYAGARAILGATLIG